MSRLGGVVGVLLVLVASMGFAALNGGQRVTLRLGVATLYRVPLTAVAFGALILGMVVMLVAGIHSDLRVRKILRERLAEEDREERARIFIDQSQTNLFDGDAQLGSAATPTATPTAPLHVNSESETS
jgi:uncharacterized integral membrane protein